MALSRNNDDGWLASAAPWSSESSQPFVPYQVDKDIQILTNEKGRNATPINLALLSQLLEKFASAGMNATYSRNNIAVLLGEGTTYRVEKREIERSFGRKERHWVAAKRAKFIMPNNRGQVRITGPSEYRRLRAVLREIEILTHPPLKQHPNIIELQGLLWDELVFGYAPILAMELAQFGNLQMFLSKEELVDSEREILCLDVACGLEAVHACCVTHGDVKLENILVCAHSGRRFIAKLSDFELALLDNDLGSYKGTPIYNAPEVYKQQRCIAATTFSGQRISPALLAKCDVFSFGLLVFEILCNGKRYYTFPESRDLQISISSEDNGQSLYKVQASLKWHITHSIVKKNRISLDYQ